MMKFLKTIKTILLIACWAFIVSPLIIAGAFGVYYYDLSKNRGYSFGYYGDFNRTKTYLSSVPGVEITSGGYNPDMFLEEFEFTLIYEGEEILLSFGEQDDVRNMPKKEAVVVLTEMVKAGSS